MHEPITSSQGHDQLVWCVELTLAVAADKDRNVLPELELLLELLSSEPEEDEELDESESDELSELALSCLRLFRWVAAFSVLAS